MSLSAKEMSQLFLKSYLNKNNEITYNIRKDGNMSIASKGIFAYIDFVGKEPDTNLIARLRMDINNQNLNEYKSLCRANTATHAIGNWGNTVTEVLLNDEDNIDLYIEIFEIARKSRK